MNPGKRISALSVVLFLVLSSCSTYLYFEKPLPPEIMPAEKKNTIAFINLFDYTKLTYTNEDKTAIHISGIKKVKEGLKTAFSEDPNFEFLVYDTLFEGRASEVFTYNFNTDSVRIICREANATMLLALEAFSVYFDQEIEVEEDSDGSKSRTAYFTLVLKAGFTLHDATGKIIDRNMITESELYLSRPALTGIYAIPPSLVKAAGEINMLATAAGKSYVARFYPSSEMVTRRLRTGKEFAEANAYSKVGNWHEATKTLMHLTESANPRIAKKAAYNLSIVYEAAGNTAMSEYWLERSLGQKSQSATEQ